MATKNSTIQTASEKLGSLGRSINGCVCNLDRVDSLLEAAVHSADSVVRMSHLVESAKLQLDGKQKDKKPSEDMRMFHNLILKRMTLIMKT